MVTRMTRQAEFDKECFCTRKIKRLNAPFQLEGKRKEKVGYQELIRIQRLLVVLAEMGL